MGRDFCEMHTLFLLTPYYINRQAAELVLRAKEYRHVCEHENNYGYFSVIPFLFTHESHYYLLLLRQIYETIIL